MAKNHRVPKYRHHKATGQAAVVFGGDWHYLGRYDSDESREKYDRLLNEWLASGRGRVVTPHPHLTVSSVLDAYLTHAGGHVGTSQMWRLRKVCKVARRLYGSSRAAEFKGRALKACRAAIAAMGHNRRHVNQLVACLQGAWRWALGEELVPAESADSVSAVAGLREGERAGAVTPPEAGEVRPVPLADFEATLPHLPPFVADLARVQLLTGCRPGEACRMRADEMDRTRPGLWVWRPGKHKTARRGHKRHVFLGPKAVEIAERYIAKGGEYLFCPRIAREERFAAMRARRKSKVQPSQASRKKADPRKVPGERYTRESYSRAVALACKKHGLAHWHPHQVRHLAGTLMENEYGIEVARIFLGHRHLSTTKIYARDDLNKVAEAVRKVG